MIAPAQQAPDDAMATPPDRRRRRLKRRRRVITTAVVIVVIVAVGGGYYALRQLRGNAPAPAADTDSTALSSVTRQSLSEQTSVDGTLGYSGSYTIVVPSASSGGGSSSGSGSSSGGTFTWLPADGQVVSQGQRLYSVENSPVVLLYGSVPVYRGLSEGMTGTDVQQLNSDLVTLGDASKSDLDPSSDYFGSATATALDKLQSDLGLTQTGTLPVGQAVFQPGAVRVGNVTATLGAQVQPGAPVLTGTLRYQAGRRPGRPDPAVRRGRGRKRVHHTAGQSDHLWHRDIHWDHCQRHVIGQRLRIERIGRLKQQLESDQFQRSRDDGERGHPAHRPGRGRPPRPGPDHGQHHDVHREQRPRGADRRPRF